MADSSTGVKRKYAGQEIEKHEDEGQQARSKQKFTEEKELIGDYKIMNKDFAKMCQVAETMAELGTK